MGNSLFGQGYDPKESQGGGERLPADGYVCKIMGAKMELAKSSGLPMVVIQFDVAEGEFANYYRGRWDRSKGFNPEAKWPGIARIPAVDEEGKARRGFNSFCGAVEKSNDCKLPTDDEMFIMSLKGKYVGIIFGDEEFEARDGSRHWTAKPRFYASVETIESGDFRIPEPKPMANNSYNSAGDFFGGDSSQVDSFAQASEDLPF